MDNAFDVLKIQTAEEEQTGGARILHTKQNSDLIGVTSWPGQLLPGILMSDHAARSGRVNKEENEGLESVGTRLREERGTEDGKTGASAGTQRNSARRRRQSSHTNERLMVPPKKPARGV